MSVTILSGNRQEEDALLRRAMGQLYSNQQAREILRERLKDYDVSLMRDEDIYAMVRDIVCDLQQSRISL